MGTRLYRGGVARPITIIVRPLVAAMALAMEQELQENDHKADWVHTEIPYRMLRVRQELNELADEVHTSHDPTKRTPKLRGRVRSEAADTCNELMFIADMRGDLEQFIPEE